MLLAKALDETAWGNLAFFIAVMDVLASLCDGGLNAALIRYLARHEHERVSTVIFRCLLLKLTLTFIISIFLVAIRMTLVAYYEMPPELDRLFLWTIFGGFLLSYEVFFLSVFVARRKFWWYGINYLAINGVRLAGVSVLYWLGSSDVRWYAISFFAGPGVAFVLSMPALRSFIHKTRRLPAPDIPYKELIAFVLPLTVVQVVGMLNMRANSFLLRVLVSPEATGYYEIPYQMGFIFLIVSGALVTVLLPKVSAMRSLSKLREYRKLLLRLYPVMTGAALLCAIAGPLFLKFFFNYARYSEALPIAALIIFASGLAVLVQPMTLIFYALGRTFWVTVIQITNFAAVVIFSLALIPYWEGAGAAMSLVCSTIITVLAVVFLSGRELDRADGSTLSSKGVPPEDAQDTPHSGP